MGKKSNMRDFRDLEQKIIKKDQLKSKLGREARKEKKLVLTNGCFDILHIGHIRYLEEAKNFGDILLVAVNSDSSVKRLKGDNRPIVSEFERARIIASLRVVDYVVVFKENDVCSIIRDVQPDIHCKGGDYVEENVPERDEVIKNGGVVKIAGGKKLRSSSNLIKKISQ